jgi:hypothetical protein
MADFVAKVGGPLQLRNFRIQRARRLNQSCAPDLFLESMLRVGTQKFFLQQYRHKADNRGTATFWQLLGQSGHAERVLANLKGERLRRLFRSCGPARMRGSRQH